MANYEELSREAMLAILKRKLLEREAEMFAAEFNRREHEAAIEILSTEIEALLALP